MIEFSYTITDPLGIHARPAGMLSKKASELDSTVTVIKDGKTADTRRLMALMQMGIRQNDTITIRIEGGNEDKNGQAILEFLETNKY